MSMSNTSMSNKASARKPYTPPQLMCFGSVASLTQSGSSKNPAENNSSSKDNPPRCGIAYPKPGGTGKSC